MFGKLDVMKKLALKYLKKLKNEINIFTETEMKIKIKK